MSTTILGKDFATITKLYFGALGKRLSGMEIDRYFILLLYLHSTPAQTQQDIAHEFKMDKTVLARVLNYLSEKGFINRVINPADRRSYIIELTTLAKEKVLLIKKANDEINHNSFNGLNENEIKTFIKTLSIIQQNLSQEPAIDFELNYK